MRVLALAFLAAAASVASAFSADTMPAHLRGGEIYRDLKAEETRILAEERQQLLLKKKQAASSGKLGLVWDETAAASVGNSPNTTINFFTQLIDHKDPSKGTFKQRYWYDLSAYGPEENIAFLHIGGEWEESSSPRGYDRDLGHSLKAALFTLEHRYYGDSNPSPLTDHETLRTLTVENALKDLVAFRDWAEANIFGGREMVWVCIGGSYPGALSTWLRLKYPNKFDAAWSSSGVVLPRFDFYDFDSAIIRVIPPACADAIRDVFKRWEAMWDGGEESRAKVLEIFGTPSYFTKQDMAWMMADGSAMGVQYGRKYEMCTALQTPSADPLVNYANYIRRIWGNHFTGNCYYSTECLSNPAFADTWAAGSYAWVFQTCYEMAYWQSGYPGSLRPEKLIDTDYYMQQCRTAWWSDILPNIYKKNREYGGLNPAIDRVIATQGSDDPWLYAGINEAPNADFPVSNAQCDNCGHCIDLKKPPTGDAAAREHHALKQQRRDIAGNLTKWIREAQKTKPALKA